MTTKRLVPELAYITDITQAQNAVVTFTDEHDYSPGEYLSFRVPKAYGMYEINQQVGRILTIGSNSVTVEIDTLGYTPFIYPVSVDSSPAITVPAGSGIIPASFPPTVNLQDCFDCVRVS